MELTRANRRSNRILTVVHGPDADASRDKRQQPRCVLPLHTGDPWHVPAGAWTTAALGQQLRHVRLERVQLHKSVPARVRPPSDVQVVPILQPVVVHCHWPRPVIKALHLTPKRNHRRVWPIRIRIELRIALLLVAEAPWSDSQLNVKRKQDLATQAVEPLRWRSYNCFLTDDNAGV